MSATPSEAQASRYRWVVEGSLLLLQFAMGLSFLAVAPLFPLIIEDFDVSRATASLLVGGTALGVAVSLIPCSMLAARLGARVSLALGGFLMSVIVLAPFAGSFGLLLMARITFAVGAAITLSATPVVIMRWFPVRELTIVNGINVIGQSLGITLSMFAAAPLATMIGWDTTLSVFGCITLLGTMIWLAAAREPVPTATPRGATPTFPISDLLATLRDRATILLGLGLAGALGANVAFGSWLPTYYHEQFGFSLEKAGAVAGLLALFGIIGSLLGSTLPVRFRRRRPFLIIAGLLLPLTAIGSFVSSNPLLLYPSVSLFGVMSWVFIPVVFTIPMELPRMTPERVGVTVAVVLSMGNLSGFAASLVVGLIRDRTGVFSVGLMIAALLAVGLAVAGYLMPETGLGTAPRRDDDAVPLSDLALPAAADGGHAIKR